ncbi:HTH-type transcriptional regulator NsrR [Polymorphum gilvum SL003B-26A1]|uniref:HTH-type transcriptional regulator NsrR n=1 Tax=Polymorphum gilvum (strain LMG 25793 / CGMCC 1.9160 / SL003B-26A1) TaxID=991905 RepID=F2J1B4_POLGS|nr:HTH-type transcriptional regulator NsrR [Polymorphum gilvum SL003B-26A1]
MSIDTIADRCRTGRPQVVHVVQILRKHGYIKSVQGRNGGIWLDRNPAEISLAEIVHLFESDLNLVECFEPKRTCRCTLQAACGFRRTLDRALQAFLAELEATTIADLAGETAALLMVGDRDGAAASVSVPAT